MASLLHLATKAPPCTARKRAVSSPPCPFFTRTHKRTGIPSVSCKAHNDEQSDSLHRRDVLIGLGGLYGANTLTSNDSAFARPVQTPKECGDPKLLPSGAIPTGCCPPNLKTATIQEFKPEIRKNPRVRQAAHSVESDTEYIKKFKEAMRLMKKLDTDPETKDDPRGFKKQAMIHCAYCNGTYSNSMSLPPELQDKAKELQVHSSWLFFPFHRAYLYYFEKILGELIGDSDFAMPYWNWDTKEGMMMPKFYTEEGSPLFNRFRDRAHYPPKMIDLDWGGTDKGLSNDDLLINNYRIMYQQMNTKNQDNFFGKAFDGTLTPNPGPGWIETKPHNNVHRWVGDPNQRNGEDMGTLYSAGREPLFYAHHANVDRLWSVWKTIGVNTVDIDHPDYLNTSFLLYNEKAELVRISVKDTLDTKKMGYVYKDITNLPWLDVRYKEAPMSKENLIAKQAEFPLVLNGPMKFTLTRPKEYRERSKAKKAFKEEVLSIGKVQLDKTQNIKIDVLVNGYLAGGYSNLPGKNDNGATIITTSFNVGLTDLLDNIGKDSAESIEVTFVPQYDTSNVKVTFTSADAIAVRLI